VYVSAGATIWGDTAGGTAIAPVTSSTTSSWSPSSYSPAIQVGSGGEAWPRDVRVTRQNVSGSAIKPAEPNVVRRSSHPRRILSGERARQELTHPAVRLILSRVEPMTTHTRSAGDASLFLCLYLLEVCSLAFALTLHRQGDRSLTAFVAAPAGLLCIATLLALIASLAAVVYTIRVAPAPRIRRLAVPLVVNVGSAAVVFGVGEAVVRVLATTTIQGPVVAGTVLLPHRWQDVAARGRATLDPAVVDRTYLVHDSELGWTNGPNRQSRDYNRQGVEQYLARTGRVPRRRVPADDLIYLSSAEGLRSPRAGMAFAAAPTTHRIAAVGDSFTFGLEVPFEATWTHQLELALGSQFQVLNFGVDGYGVDQAYLRYRRDVAAWKPEIVILGMIDDDFRRTMCVYGFLCFQGFGMPFSKPRLVLSERGLTPLNLPLPPRETIFAKSSITELPFVEFDGAYTPADWRWSFYHRAYAVRFLLSRYPRFSIPRAPVTDEAMMSLNTEIVRQFVRLARERGSIPIVVYFPSYAWQSTSSSPARAALDAHHIRYLDMTRCVDTVSSAERFVALHYSARANATVAGCLRDAIDAGFESGYEAGDRKTSSISTW
jgi:hypothetical protein